MKAMRKYTIGLTILGLITFGLLVFTVIQGINHRSDVKTYEKAQKIATSLNDYIDKNNQIPDTLATAGVTDIPSTITYEKQSSAQYLFCATYKQASEVYGGASPEAALLSTIGGVPATTTSVDSSKDAQYSPEALYIDPWYTAGENCQTIKPYLTTDTYDSSDYDSDFWNNYLNGANNDDFYNTKYDDSYDAGDYF